jgi:hypothetical protein
MMSQAGPLPSKNSLNLSELRGQVSLFSSFFKLVFKVLIGQLPDDFLRVSMPKVDANNLESIPQDQDEQQQTNISSISQQIPYQFGSAVCFLFFQFQTRTCF